MVKITRADRMVATDYILHEIDSGRAVISKVKEGKTTKVTKIKRHIEIADNGTMYVNLEGMHIPLENMRSKEIVKRQHYNPSEYHVSYSDRYNIDCDKYFDSLKEARKFAYSAVYGNERLKAYIWGPNTREKIQYYRDPDGEYGVCSADFRRWVPITRDGRALTSRQVIFNERGIQLVKE